MCGICGVAYADARRPGEAGLVQAMVARLAHRGPDGSGVTAAAGVALGHSRLAVIDLSTEAAQPMAGEDGKVLAVVNGEIYNHRALRAGLEAKGHRFRSRSDSEVVVHLYEEHGPAAVERLEGMFAIAIWDARSATLLLARDAMGEKPLCYHESPGRLLFASEIGALLADSEIARAPDDLAIHHYLTFKCVPSPLTGLEGVRKIPPGHLMIWRAGRGSVRAWTRLPTPAEARRELARGDRVIGEGTGSGREVAELGRARPGDAGAGATIEPAGSGGERVGATIDPAGSGGASTSERLREAIGRAVEERLEADVPVGVLLSGGLDSAIVAYEAARRVGPSLRTFTVGFAEADYDESDAAAAIAARIGSDHHPVSVRTDVVSELPAIVARYGEPFGDSSAVAVWSLAREVRRHVTVALGGDGGDELFGGYDRHRAVRLGREIGRAGAGRLLSALGRGAASLPLARGRRSLLGRLDRFARAASRPPLEANEAWVTCFSGDDKRFLCTAEFTARMTGVDSMSLLRAFYTGSADPLDDMLRADLSLALPDDLLFKVDIASMASALEVRSPMLDPDLVRLAFSIPAGDKIGRRRGKQVLRDAYAGLLPEATIRGRKAGFGLPVDRWLRGPLKAMASDLLLSGRFATRGYFNSRAVEALLREHEEGRVNHDDRIWTLLCLELWFRTIVEGEAS